MLRPVLRSVESEGGFFADICFRGCNGQNIQQQCLGDVLVRTEFVEVKGIQRRLLVSF
jgi:hypothetical protein